MKDTVLMRIMDSREYLKARKIAFSEFVSLKSSNIDNIDSRNTWRCCDIDFNCLKEIHIHVSKNHMNEVLTRRDSIIQLSVYSNHKDDPLTKSQCVSTTLPVTFSHEDVYEWLPKYMSSEHSCALNENQGKIVLFYQYKEIGNPKHVKAWQEELCFRLKLTGKVRVSEEGLNATVGGTTGSVDLYIQTVLNHPLFMDMTPDQFKTSKGSAADFPDGLKVGIYKEAVPMGLDPIKLSAKDAGKHLNSDEFHQALMHHKKEMNSKDREAVFIDCRNFYESKIGYFENAVCPDIRKFSYWPEYVDKNLELFKDKNVYMYCTGGIRCERGSAYLKSKDICRDVFQLEGGIHKYIEKYPDGFFKGKLFVFDDRYHIEANKSVVGKCVYCNEPWDKYKPCSSRHCHQLVLSCELCRDSKQRTACCTSCQLKNEGDVNEQCECTNSRPRIPLDVIEENKDNQK